jgi:hypothetical protein
MRRMMLVISMAAMLVALFASAPPAAGQDGNNSGFATDAGGNCPEGTVPNPNFPRGTGTKVPCIIPPLDEGTVFPLPPVDQDIEQESESGDVSIGFDVSNSGDFASQCTPAVQFGNTGNFQNASSFVQFGSGNTDGFRDRGFFGHHFFNRGGIDDFEPEGIDVSFGGSQDVSCPSTIQQSSAASS